MLTDFEIFMERAVKFIDDTVPTATKEKRERAAIDLAKAFRFLFDKEGKRIAAKV